MIGRVIELHAYVEVDDIERGVVFYTEGLGLQVLRRLTPRWVELTGASIPVHLLGGRPDSFDAGGHTLRRAFTRHWTPVHLDFVVKDLDGTVSTAVDAGATLERAVSEHSWGRMANLADPFGNGFDLIALSASGYESLAPGALPPDKRPPA